MRRVAASCVPASVLMLLCLAHVSAFAQPASPVEEKGFQQNRDYFSELPFEHVDLLCGGLVLTFTDLVLPGNAGRDLRFQRTWNSKGTPRWTFGIPGVAMRVLDPGWAPVDAVLLDNWTWTPTVVTADGASRRATWMDTPDTSTVASIRETMRWVSTAEFWRYNRELRQMYLPDGTVCQYDGEGRLTQVTDVFGNEVTVQWHDGGVTVRQRFGTAPSREILLEGMDADGLRPTAMRYEGRTWTYAWGAAVDRVIPPVGPGWEYTRETDLSSDAGGQLIQVRTPGAARSATPTSGRCSRWTDRGPIPRLCFRRARCAAPTFRPMPHRIPGRTAIAMCSRPVPRSRPSSTRPSAHA